MQIVHVLTPSILLALDDGLNIVGVRRVPSNYRPEPGAVCVSDLYSTPHGKPRFVEGGFETDGLGCTVLGSWVARERPKASDRAARNRFYALFADNPDEATKAALRIYVGTDATAVGEPAYFSSAQWANHPDEMAAIKMLGEIARTGTVPGRG